MRGNTLQIAIAHSDDVDEEDVVSIVSADLQAQLGGLPDATMIFCSPEYDLQLLGSNFSRQFGDIPLIGVTGHGVFSSKHGCIDDSLGIVGFRGTHTQFSFGYADSLGRISSETTLDALKTATLGRSGTPKAIYLYIGRFLSNAESAVRAASNFFNTHVPIYGGIAGDNSALDKKNTGGGVFCSNQGSNSAVAILCVWGNYNMSSGAQSGAQWVGSKTEITKSDGNIVYEIDDQPAAQFLTDRFGIKNEDIGLGFGLTIFDKDDNLLFVRSVFNVDIETGSITFAGEVPQGTNVAITFGNLEAYMKGVDMSCAHALELWGSTETPSAAIVISCAGRRWVMGGSHMEEVSNIRNKLEQPPRSPIPFLGFYSYGEIAPVNNQNHLHNETCVVHTCG